MVEFGCKSCGAEVPVTPADEAGGRRTAAGLRMVLKCPDCKQEHDYLLTGKAARGARVREEWRKVTVPMALAGLAVALVFGFTAGFGGGFAVGTMSRPVKKAADTVYTRSEFKRLVMDKTPTDIKAAIGDPDRVNSDGNWVYGYATVIPPAKQVDTYALVVYGKDKSGQTVCVRVEFH